MSARVCGFDSSKVQPSMNSTHLVRNCSWLAALTCLLWDSVSVWPQEYEYIWRSRSSLIKWLYILSRYSAVIAQTANCVLFFGPLSTTTIQEKTCRSWFAINIGEVVCLYLTLEATLTIRVWALYRQDKSIRVFIAVTFVTGLVFNCITNAWTVSKLNFNAQCIASSPPKAFICMWVEVVTIQVSLMTLTMNKKRIAERDGWSKTPVIKVLIRDSAWIFVAIIAIALAISPYALKVDIPAHFMVAWPVTLMSIMTCRIVLNMLTMNTSEETLQTELSTNVPFDFSALFPNSLSTTTESVPQKCPQEVEPS